MTTARDAFGSLICPHAECGSVIRAFTGLQELEKLIAHYARKHHKYLSMNDALMLRAAHEEEWAAAQ